MRTSFRLAVTVCGLWGAATLAVAPGHARADGMDVALSRLAVDNAAIGTDDHGNPVYICNPAASRCQDDYSWGALIQQLGVSMAPPILAPAASLGPGRFSMGYEAWMTTIASDRPFWQNGTEGRIDPSTHTSTEGSNRFTSSPLYWHRINVRMAFPFGFQLGTNVGQMIGSSYFTAGLEVQWSLFEGFRRWGWLPDVAVRGAVQILFGETEFDLTVPTVDVIMSKSITLGNIGTLTPFIAGQVLFILGDSELVDLTPNCDSHEAATPACRPGPTGIVSDSFNNAVFAQIRKNRGRAVLGFQLRFSWFMLTGSFAFDVTGADLGMQGPGLPSLGGPALPPQYTVAFGASATF